MLMLMLLPVIVHCTLRCPQRRHVSVVATVSVALKFAGDTPAATDCPSDFFNNCKNFRANEASACKLPTKQAYVF